MNRMGLKTTQIRIGLPVHPTRVVRPRTGGYCPVLWAHSLRDSSELNVVCAHGADELEHPIVHCEL